MTLDASARERDNSFDVLRLAAAALVLVSHSFVVVGAAEPHIGDWPLGAFGVEIFFAISGFLVAKSWLSAPHARAFAVKRGLRILPALLVTVVACAFLLGPAVSDEPVGEYYGSLEPAGYVVDNMVSVATGGVVRDVAHDLPEVFDENPTHSVNLSLWTLPIEVRAYMLVALLGVLGLLGRGLPLVAAGFFALSIAPASIADTPGAGSGLEFMRGTDGETAHLIALFAVAGLAYVWRSRIALRVDLALAALAALVLSLGTPLERVALLFAIPYLTLFLAYRSWAGLRVLTRHADVSYGLYLLAFPVSQTVLLLWGGGGRPGPLVVALIAFPITYLLALASWYGVEKRALRLKGALAAPRAARGGLGRPAPEAEPAPIRT
jgi:peptidoglycan/LPS O-acetylase OafA/YrhL